MYTRSKNINAHYAHNMYIYIPVMRRSGTSLTNLALSSGIISMGSVDIQTQMYIAILSVDWEHQL